jgi:pimeloyl-ACP methyl ester carboxylesterase
VSLAVAADRGSGPLVVLLHGFPELPSCWDNQLDPLVERGLRVVTPYLRGYGPSLGPAEPAGYTADLLAGDVVALLDELGVERALLVGHDWGAQVTWWTAQLHPDRVAAVAALSVPFTGRSATAPLARFRELFGDSFFYMDYFQQPGVAEAEFAEDLRGLLLRLYLASSATPPAGALRKVPREGGRLGDQLPAVPPEPPAWLPATELDTLVDCFTRYGLTGPLNFYRAMDVSWAELPQLGELAVRCPALFAAGERDPVVAFTPLTRMQRDVADLRGPVLLPGAGHWVQREAAAAVTDLLTGFLVEHADRAAG